MSLFTLAAKIVLDTKNFDDNIKRTGSEFHGVGAKAIAMGQLIADGTRAGISAVKNLAQMGINYNSQMEGYTSNFKVMLGSTEAAAQRVEDLKTMAAKTPFGMSDLAEATQTLLAFQVPAEKTNNVLKMLGDVALGDREKMKGLALVFGQVSSAGKLQGQDLMQMINQGFNPLNYISKRTGESMEELRKRMSAGAVSAQEVEQAFIDATSAGGQFYNGMEEASKTQAGLMSTLKDNAMSLVGEVFTPISQSMTADLLPAAIDSVEQLTETFHTQGVLGMAIAAGDMAGTALANFTQNAIEGLPHIVDSGFQIISALMQGMSEKAPEIANNVGECVTQLASSVAENAPHLIAQGALFLGHIIAGFAKSIPDLVEQIPEAIKGLAEELTDPENLADLAQIGVDIVVGVGKGIISMGKYLWDLLVKSAEPVGEPVKAGGLTFQWSSANASGLETVPYDGYVAQLHKGERVLTADEAREYRNPAPVQIVQNIYAQRQTAADLMQAARFEKERSAWLGV